MKCSEFKVKYDQALFIWRGTRGTKDDHITKLMKEIYPQLLDVVLKYAVNNLQRRVWISGQVYDADGCVRLYVGKKSLELTTIRINIDITSEYTLGRLDFNLMKPLATLLKNEFESDGYIVDVDLIDKVAFRFIIGGWED